MGRYDQNSEFADLNALLAIADERNSRLILIEINVSLCELEARVGIFLAVFQQKEHP